MTELLIPALIAVVIGILSLWLFPNATENIFERINNLRQIGTFIVVGLLVVTALQSGIWWFGLIGLFMLVFIVWFYNYEYRNERIV